MGMSPVLFRTARRPLWLESGNRGGRVGGTVGVGVLSKLGRDDTISSHLHFSRCSGFLVEDGLGVRCGCLHWRTPAVSW